MPENPFDRLARFYELEHADYLEDLPFYLGLARRLGGPVLELAAGSGRLVIPLAEAGFEVVGVDSSAAMLATARARLSTSPAAGRVELRAADLRTTRLGRRFRLVIVGLDSFALLVDRADQLAALETARRHLYHRGLLVIDVSNGNLRGGEALTELTCQSLSQEGGPAVIKWVARETDPAEQLDRLEHHYDEVGPDGLVRRTSVDLELRYFVRSELELLLERAGFVVEAVFGGYDLSPFGVTSERLILLAHVGRDGPAPPRTARGPAL